MDSRLLEDVFGLTRDIPLTYTARETVDTVFKTAVTKKNHIVIYGCSKQGKTCLRKSHLHDDKCVVIQCDPQISIADINKKILRAAGYQVTIKDNTGSTKEFDLRAKVTATILKLVGAEIEGGVKKSYSKNIDTKPLELDLNSHNDVIDILKQTGFSKYVLLEDFHNLNQDIQDQISIALKGFYDNSNIVFIIIGVWKEANRIINLNRDLLGRTISIDADQWQDDDFESLIEIGTRFLNVRFSEDLIETLLDNSYGSVFFIQEMCFEICKHYRITKTVATDGPRTKRHVSDDDENDIEERLDDGRYEIPYQKEVISDIINLLVSQYTSQYQNIFLVFDDINDENIIAKHLLKYLIMNDAYEMLGGIELKAFKKYITTTDLEPRLKQSSSLIRCLRSLNSMQAEKQLKPDIFEFDYSLSKINIVDKTFLIWLNNQDKNELNEILNEII